MSDRDEQKGPTNDANLIHDTISHVAKQDYAALLQYCDGVISNEPLEPPLELLIGVARCSALINTGDVPKGLTELQAIRRKLRGEVDGLVCCIVLAAFGFWREALESSAASLHEGPGADELCALVGVLRHVLLGALDRLMDNADAGLFLEPPSAADSLTWTLDASNIEDTRSVHLDSLNRAVESYPTNVDLLVVLAHLHFALAAHEDVIKTCRQLRAVDPTNRHLFLEARSLAALDSFEQAEQVVRVQFTTLLREIKSRLVTAMSGGEGTPDTDRLIAQARNLGNLRVLHCEVTSLASLCRNTAHSRTVASPAETVSASFDIAVEDGVHTREVSARSCGGSVYCLRDTEVLDMTGMMLTGGQHLVSDPMPEDPRLMNHWPYLHAVTQKRCLLTPPAATRWQGPAAATVAQGFGANYYSWLIEVVPRIQLLRDHRGELPALVFLYQLRPWQREVLDLIDVPPERVVCLPGSPPIAFDELWLAHTSTRELPSPAPLLSSRDLLRERLSLSKTPGQRKLFITRKQYNNRKLVNEAEVGRMLIGQGFEPVSPEEMSISEQAECFASAAVVIGPCGAWATNTIFCQPDTPIILLNPAESCGLHFAYIAHWLGLRYTVALGQFVPTPSVGILGRGERYFDVPTPDSMHHNYHVPLQAVEVALTSVC